MTLELRDVVFRQGSFTLSANLVLVPGRYAVIGASGSGKSTFLSLLGGFLHPDQGLVLWQDRDITRTAPGQRPISMLFQHHNLFPHLTIKQNVGLGLRPDLRLTRQEWHRAADALERVGLQGTADRRPGALSGGQQGRAALARVLLRARPLLLLDEPFAALGPALKSEMLDLVLRISDDARATVLMVTHDPADARAFAPETVLVEDGHVHPPRPTAPLLDNPPPGLRAYLG